MAFLTRPAALTFVAVLALIHSTTAAAPQATVINGTYIGVHSNSYNQDLFLGMPYARAPVGPLRFAVPRPLNTSFSAPRSAAQYGAACVGYGSDDDVYPVLSEDCLFVNVVRPSGYSWVNLPVTVWIHGGGYFQGSISDPRYNLSAIVKQVSPLPQTSNLASVNKADQHQGCKYRQTFHRCLYQLPRLCLGIPLQLRSAGGWPDQSWTPRPKTGFEVGARKY